jgi:hypothetical protein
MEPTTATMMPPLVWLFDRMNRTSFLFQHMSDRQKRCRIKGCNKFEDGIFPGILTWMDGYGKILTEKTKGATIYVR